MLRDHFALGTLVVDRAGDGVAVAHADEALAKRVLAGDGVRLVSAKRADWAEPPSPSLPLPPSRVPDRLLVSPTRHGKAPRAGGAAGPS